MGPKLVIPFLFNETTAVESMGISFKETLNGFRQASVLAITLARHAKIVQKMMRRLLFGNALQGYIVE